MDEKVIKSIKLDYKKTFRILWIVMAVILASVSVFSCVDYLNYKKGQETAVDLLVATGNFYFDEDDDYETKARYLYNRLTVDYEYESKYWGLDYSDVTNSARKADIALGELLTEMGYSTWLGSYYLEHTDFFSYAFDYAGLHIIILFSISLGLILLLFIVYMVYLDGKKKSIEIVEDSIVCKKGSKTKKQFMVRDIKSISFSGIKGLKIIGSGIKYNINLVKNREEIKNTIMSMIAESNQNTNIISAYDNSADTLAKYKDLLDSGAITQEEFDAKKKQLLGL